MFRGYHFDGDEDGLANVLDFYGADAFEGAFLYVIDAENSITTRRRREADEIEEIETEGDSDSDSRSTEGNHRKLNTELEIFHWQKT